MTRSELIEFLEHPTETLAVEIKRWLSPDDPSEAAKIARSLIALRNFDGGILILGLDNEKFAPVEHGRPADLQTAYHSDKLQSLVARHSRPTFEIDIQLIPASTSQVIVIVVPGGVTAPVMARSTIRDGERIIVEQNAVYTRCLANDRVSSCKPVTREDWDNLIGRCFANREVDVGRFIQRHVPQLLEYLHNTPAAAKAGVVSSNSAAEKNATPQSQADKDVDRTDVVALLDYGFDRFKTRVSELRASNKIPELPPHGSWEVACIVEGAEPKYTASTKFLDELFIHQPGYTGYPMWRDTRSVENEIFRPYTFARGWEALVVRLRETFFYNNIDFWRIEPRGRFYEYRALEDDIAGVRANQRIPPLKVLDFLLVIGRVTEAIGVCVQYAKGLRCSPEMARLIFGFRWRKLAGRELASWAEPLRTLFPSSQAIQDEVTTKVVVPLSIGTAEIPHFVREATVELFEVFGKEFPLPIYEEIGAKILHRT